MTWPCSSLKAEIFGNDDKRRGEASGNYLRRDPVHNKGKWPGKGLQEDCHYEAGLSPGLCPDD